MTCTRWSYLYRSQRFLFSSAVSCHKFGGGFMQVSEEVQEAVTSKKAVVALESTIITHGMPYPDNLSTALCVEKKVREKGAVPATIAVINGRICVGLNNTELAWLAERNRAVIKVSRRDFPYILSKGLSGGTTVSATMIAAHMAGIAVFATGGIGGVHRGAETSFDVSADLTELGRTPVAVVSSGVKSILDIPKTLEYLETQGVCVVTFDETNNFPAFFTRDSGYYAPYSVATYIEAARMIDIQLRAGLNSGMLIAVPIPDEFAATGDVIQEAIKEALELSRKNNIVGKEVTPYILNMVSQLTKGESLVANIALIENNASVAGEIACCLAKIQASAPPVDSSPPSLKLSSKSGQPNHISSLENVNNDNGAALEGHCNILPGCYWSNYR
uniref:Pseudouridine-5'-phosphate glycosidase n=1 Tax=Arion vulgaris TaxID=1028688 RepID=A0A0B6ZZW0_9EUPU